MVHLHALHVSTIFSGAALGLVNLCTLTLQIQLSATMSTRL